MRRLRLVLEYDGTGFCGFQRQPSQPSVQEALEAKLSTVCGHPVTVVGAGRTDAGVHALGQVTHFDTTGRIPVGNVERAVNSLPGMELVVRQAEETFGEFHARFSAKGKTYRYRIWNDSVVPPLEHGRAWHVPVPLDLSAVAAEAEAFVGTHDFASFAANRGKPGEETVRTIASVRLQRTGKCIALEFSGDGFLYKMVRLMVGALVRRGHGKAAAGEIALRLRAASPTPEAARLVAPASGLFLVRVRY